MARIAPRAPLARDFFGHDTLAVFRRADGDLGHVHEEAVVALRRAEETHGIPIPTLRKLIARGKLRRYGVTTRVLISVEELGQLIAASATSK